MRITAAALLGLVLAGCAPAARLSPPPRLASSRPATPTEQAVEEIDADADVDDSLSSDDALGEFLAETGAAMLANEPADDPADPSDADNNTTAVPQEFGGFEPEVIHRAKIDMARAALVEENLNKERVDLAEELQRELAALQASQASKSRARRGSHTKKQP